MNPHPSQENPAVSHPHDRNETCLNEFSAIKQRLDKLEQHEWRKALEKVDEKVTNLSVQFAKLDGKIIGAVAASGVAGGIISFLVQYLTKR